MSLTRRQFAKANAAASGWVPGSMAPWPRTAPIIPSSREEGRIAAKQVSSTMATSSPPVRHMRREKGMSQNWT